MPLLKTIVQAEWLHLTPSSVLISQDPNHRFGGNVTDQGRKEMFYLTMHSTHFIYGYMASYTW